ncbi:hypothetical protein HYT23_02140 [Candidatus Pacearchaeota archaeon]|nr:hypothetical protein [Candidatus Pacearchaeota archaeon]
MSNNMVNINILKIADNDSNIPHSNTNKKSFCINNYKLNGFKTFIGGRGYWEARKVVYAQRLHNGRAERKSLEGYKTGVLRDKDFHQRHKEEIARGNLKTVDFNAILIRGNLKNRPTANKVENQKKPRGCF